MSAENKTTLKTYFETNDIPTQGQYANFIDSYPNVVDENQAVGIDSDVVPVYPPTQGTAYGISARYNFISSVGTNTAAIILPPATVGKMITVGSGVSNSVTVYPASGEKFDVIATNTGYLIYQRELITFVCLIAGEWTWISNAPENGHYFVYEAIINQTGTNAPVDTVLGNNHPGTMVWSYTSLGIFRITNTGNLPSAKSVMTMTPHGTSNQGLNLQKPTNDDYFIVSTFNNANGVGNALLINNRCLIKTLRY